MNIVVIGGRLGQDPELRFTQNNNALLKLRVATDYRYKDGNEWKNGADWHDITVFGKRAETLQKYLKKGEYIVVHGRLSTRSWNDKDGNRRYSTEVIAEEVDLTGLRGQRDRRSGPDDEGDGWGSGEQQAPKNFADDDIPF